MSEIRTKELSDTIENELENHAGIKNKITFIFKRSRGLIRRIFASSSEKSLVASFVDNLYFALISCKARVFATFLLTFSAVSLMFCYIASPSLNHYVSDENTFHSFAALIISFVLFACNSSLHEIISSSKILSKLSIIYNQSNSLFGFSGEKLPFEFNYSTAFFIGIISGIFSVMYSVSSILCFYISLLCVILIFNRPECGLLTTALLIPVLNEFTLIFFVAVTLISFLYRFLIGKRHMDFGFTEILILLCVLYVSVRFAVSGNSYDIKTFLFYLIFFLGCIFTMNLIRTTVMFRRCFSILIRMTRIYTCMMVIYLVCSIILTPDSVLSFIQSLEIESLITVLTNKNFIIPFLVISIPINFAQTISSTRKQDLVSGIIFTAALLLSAFLLSSYTITLIVLLSCSAVLFFCNKRNAYLFLVCPAVAYVVFKISSGFALPFAKNPVETSAVSSGKSSLNYLFGNGFGGANPAASSAYNIFAEIGIVGTIIFTVTLIVILVKAFKALSLKGINADKSRTLSVGLISSIIFFVIMCFFDRMLLDFRCIYLFSVVLSLSYSAKKCYKADFIDVTAIREHI